MVRVKRTLGNDNDTAQLCAIDTYATIIHCIYG